MFFSSGLRKRKLPCHASRLPSLARLRFEQLEDRRLLTAGFLDPTFDGDGIVTANVGLADYGSEQVTAVALQPDGKIIAVGNAASDTYQDGFKRGDIAVVRYDTDGTLDNTFSGDGKTTTALGKNTPSGPTDVAVQFDGKIVVSAIATGDFEMVRYNANGSLDTAFGGKGTGRVTTAIGKNSNDNAFAMELQADHKIVLAGVTKPQNSSTYDLALARYNLDGSLDPTFSGDGKTTTNFGYSLSNPDMGLEMAIYPSTSPYAGRIVVVSALLSPFTSSDNGVIVARYLPSGNLDPDFGVGGTGYVNLTSFGGNPGYDNGAGVAIQANDGIVVGRTGAPRIGGGADMYLARFQPNGILDPAFGTAGTGIAQTLLRDDNDSPGPGSPISKSLAIQADGKIVVGVNVYFTNHTKDKMVVARYNTNGSLDDGSANDSMPSDSFGVRGIATGIATSTGATVTHVEGMAIQADGQIVIGGQAGGGTTGRPADFALARFLGDDPPAPLLAASVSEPAAGRTLSRDQVEPLLTEAFVRWQAVGVDVSSLHGVDIRIADLPGAILGQASGNTIWLDGNAAGWGWFIDSTPQSDSEFTTPGNQGEQNHMDLLTVVMHELGHLLGRAHEDTGVMSETLAAGIRHTPGLAATDWLFAHSAAEGNDWQSVVATPGAHRQAR